jgi:hypothetical protein
MGHNKSVILLTRRIRHQQFFLLPCTRLGKSAIRSLRSSASDNFSGTRDTIAQSPGKSPLHTHLFKPPLQTIRQTPSDDYRSSSRSCHYSPTGCHLVRSANSRPHRSNTASLLDGCWAKSSASAMKQVWPCTTVAEICPRLRLVRIDKWISKTAELLVES